MAEEVGYTGREAVWIDARNNASTYSFSSLGDDSMMERVKIGRAFTPRQHHTLVQRLENFLTEETEIIVLPGITSLYLQGQVRDWEAEELFNETWQKIRKLKQDTDLKILVSATQDSFMDFKVIQQADKKIQVQETSQGKRLDSSYYTQKVYTDFEGFQTTLFYWEEAGKTLIREAV